MENNIYIIAEIGMNHDGSYGQAKAMIKAAAKCGADAIKLQTHIANAESLPNAHRPNYFTEESRIDYFLRTAFSKQQLHSLRKYTKEDCGIDFICSPFSEAAVELLEEINIDAYKIASGEVTNLPLLAKLAKTRKKIFISSGMSNWQEIDQAINLLRTNGVSDLTVLQCTSEYPCLPENSGLNIIKEFKDRYDLPVGFSDHTLGLHIAVAAVSLGATTIEKHFTLSQDMYGPDAKFSITPENFTLLIKAVRETFVAISNSVDKNLKAVELDEMKVIFEKSIVARHDLQVGTILEHNHLDFKKPGNGINANKFNDVVGKRLNRHLTFNEQLKWDDLQ